MDLETDSRGRPRWRREDGGRQAVAHQQYHGQGDMQMVNRTAAGTLVDPPNPGCTAP